MTLEVRHGVIGPSCTVSEQLGEAGRAMFAVSTDLVKTPLLAGDRLRELAVDVGAGVGEEFGGYGSDRTHAAGADQIDQHVPPSKRRHRPEAT